MKKSNLIPTVICIVANTLLMVLIFALSDFDNFNNGIFEDFLLIFAHLFWIALLAGLNLIVSLILFLSKVKDTAFSFLAGGIYAIVAGPIFTIALLYLKLLL